MTTNLRKLSQEKLYNLFKELYNYLEYSTMCFLRELVYYR